MEISYCGGCGKALREDDFRRGLAQMLDNRPWCAECRPPDKKPITGAIPVQGRKSGSSAKHPRVTPAMPASKGAAESSNRHLLIGLAIAGLGTLVALAVLASGKETPPPAPVVAPPRSAPEPPVSEDLDRLLNELEAFASLSAPEKILARCDELRARFRGSPQEARFQAIEAAAQEQKKGREKEIQLGRDLDALQKLIDEDPKFQRMEEVHRRFHAAKAIAGVRAGELARRLAEYEKARKESPHEKHLGPFATDAEGFILNWLVLGIFPNDQDKGLDIDFLKGEGSHDPVAGTAVGKLKWATFGSEEPKIDFFKVSHLGIRKPKDQIVAYAACIVQVPVDVAAEFRLGSDDGGSLWVDGRQVGKVHKARSLKLDEDRYAVPLAPGVHRVLVKVENHGVNFEFALRVVAPDGNRVPSLRVWN